MTTQYAVAVKRGEFVAAVAITSSFDHTCALLADVTIECWGSNEFGQLGDGTRNVAPSPVAVIGLTGTETSIKAGAYHSCALAANGTVRCWGRNTEGQLGNATLIDEKSPVKVGNLSAAAKQIVSGRKFSCALLENGSVQCWGDNAAGTLGNGSIELYSAIPVTVTNLDAPVVALANGSDHVCALEAIGAVKCWGENEQGQLGIGFGTSKNIPQSVQMPPGVVSRIYAGGPRSCAAMEAGQFYCWGWLGTYAVVQTGNPVTISGLSERVFGAALGQEHTCVIVPVAHVLCWGLNYNGQLGDGTTELRGVPTAVARLSGTEIDVVAGNRHTCILLSSGAVQCWGGNSLGQLGDGTTTDRPFPTQVTQGRPKRVVLLPGTLASGNWDCFLYKTRCEQNYWDWFRPQHGPFGRNAARDKYAGLTSDLTKAGYEVKVFFYDWRRSISDNVDELAQFLQLIGATSSQPVTLIGHSQGGLLARAYIQSPQFISGSIDTLITLGAPHKGLARAFPYWNGAEFYRLADSFSLESLGLSYLMDVIYDANATNCPPISLQSYDGFMVTDASLRDKCKKDVRTFRPLMPIFKDFLPTYDYVYEEDSHSGAQLVSESSLSERNTYLHALNRDIQILYDRVLVVAIAANNRDTPVRMVVKSPSADTRANWPYNWPDGQYISKDDSGNDPNLQPIVNGQRGDNTIPYISAIPDDTGIHPKGFASYTVDLEPEKNHADMANDVEVRTRICEALGSTCNPTPLAVRSLARSVDAEPVDPVYIYVVGAVTASITSLTSIDFLDTYADANNQWAMWVISPTNSTLSITISSSMTTAYQLKVINYGAPTGDSISSEAFEHVDWAAPSVSTTLVLKQGSSPSAALIAPIPIVDLPVISGAPISGRSVPGATVTLFDDASGEKIGSATVLYDGSFTITPSRPLKLNQVVHVEMQGTRSRSQIVIAAHVVQLPLVVR